MASTASETHTFRAGDGLYYETYEEMRQANIRKNDERLQQLGLLPGLLRGAGPEGQATKRKRASRTTSTAMEPTRRSSRAPAPRQIPNVHSMRNRDSDDEDHGRASKRGKKKLPKKLKDDWSSPLMQQWKKQREEEIKADTTWFDEFKKYWRNKLSDQNYRTIIRQASKLASGRGIDYHHWPPDVYFCKDQAVDMSSDFEALYEKAILYEQMYGKDLGHGWLVKIPLRKLSIFQKFYFERLIGGVGESVERPTEQIYPIGTKFEKEFPDYGTFVGEIKSFDGMYYHVYYADDGDEEDLSEGQLDALKMLTPVPKREAKEQQPTAKEDSNEELSQTGVAPVVAARRYPVGTKFAKVFAEFGAFIGEVVGFDGTYYNVYYPTDGDREDLTEEELSRLSIIETPREPSTDVAP